MGEGVEFNSRKLRAGRGPKRGKTDEGSKGPLYKLRHAWQDAVEAGDGV